MPGPVGERKTIAPFKIVPFPPVLVGTEPPLGLGRVAVAEADCLDRRVQHNPIDSHTPKERVYKSFLWAGFPFCARKKSSLISPFGSLLDQILGPGGVGLGSCTFLSAAQGLRGEARW